MNTELLSLKFARIGARFKLADRPARRSPLLSGLVRFNIREDRDGEFFEMSLRPEANANGVTDYEYQAIV